MADAPFNPPRTRVRRHLEEAEQREGISGVPAGASAIPGDAASTPDANASPKSGVSFFKGRRANTAESNAKKQALVNKLRGPAKVDASDANGDLDD